MIFFAALIGSIFGLMQSFGILMAFTENSLEKVKKVKSETKKLEAVKKARKALLDLFNIKYKIKKKTKRSESSSIMPDFELKII